MRLHRSIVALATIFVSLACLGADFATERAALEARLASTPDSPEVLVALGKLFHNRSTLGDSDAKETARLAEKHLRHLLKVSPTNAFGRALLGSTITLGARDAFLPTTKIRLVRQGLAEMDAALKEHPDDANARFTRGANNVFLPDFFKRKDFVLKDFEWLTDAVTREPQKYDNEFRQYVAMYHGIALRRYGELDKAVGLWQSGLAIDPNSKVAELIRKEQTRKES